MPTESVVIRNASPQDAETLAPFAATVFRQTFEGDPDHRPEDMALHLASAYSAAQLARELETASIVYFLAESANSLVGYAKLCQEPPPACVSGPDPIEIARLYVDFNWHGRGVANRLMERAFEHASSLGCRTIWLGVWRRNHRARRFYEKWGFRHVGDHPFLFGSDPQRDEVYVRSVPPDAEPPAAASRSR